MMYAYACMRCGEDDVAALSLNAAMMSMKECVKLGCGEEAMAARDMIIKLFTGWRLNNALMMRSQVMPDFRLQHAFAVDLGIDGFIAIARYYHTAFPGWQIDATFLTETDAQVELLVHMSGTHLGPYPNLLPGRPAIPPTGRRFEVRDIPATVILRDNKIALIQGNDLTQQKADQIFAQLLATDGDD